MSGIRFKIDSVGAEAFLCIGDEVILYRRNTSFFYEGRDYSLTAPVSAGDTHAATTGGSILVRVGAIPELCAGSIAPCQPVEVDNGTSATSSHYKATPVDQQPTVVAFRQLTKDQFAGAMRFNIIKYTCRMGRKASPDTGKIQQYAEWLNDSETKDSITVDGTTFKRV